MERKEEAIRIPDLGEVDEVRLVGWLAASGSRVELDQDLLEVETEKTTFVIPSPATGRLTHGEVSDGDIVRRGDVVGVIEAGE